MEESSDVPAVVGVPKDGTAKEKAIRKPSALLYLLIGGLILLLVAGIALLAAYFYLARLPAAPEAWIDPVNGTRSEAIAPDLAVLPLAGEPDDRVVRAALDAGELETAYATLSYSALLPDSLRGGHWLLFTEGHNAGSQGKDRPGQVERSHLKTGYQAALDVAALSPSLSDMTRSDLAVQAGQGLAALGYKAAAHLALTEAENVARYSLTLLPAQRRDMLSRVIQGYRSIGDDQAASLLQSQLSKASAGPGVKLPPPEDILGELRGSVVLPEHVTVAIQARQQAAAALAARWLSADAAGRSELALALGQALETEDQAHNDFFARLTSLSEADQLAMLHDRVSWLTIKYRVARGAYGLSLVKDWEGQVDEIGGELAAAYTELINGYGRLLDTLEAGKAAEGRMQLLQQGLLWVRLGLFPDHAEPALSQQLIEAAQQLWSRRGGAGLVVGIQQVDDQRYYLLAGSGSAPGQQTPAAKP